MDEIGIQKFLRAISIRFITGAMLLGLTPIAFAAPKQEIFRLDDTRSTAAKSTPPEISPVKETENNAAETNDSHLSQFDYPGIVSFNPIFAEDYFDLGTLKHESGEFQAAIANYNQAIQIKPEYADAFHSRGLAKKALGDNLGAIADYDQALKLQPDSPNSYYGRGVVKKKLGDIPQALADFQEAARLYQKQGNSYWYSEAQKRVNELGG